MIVLKEMQWSNCYSYGKELNNIDFSKNTITQVLGENGHGKSSIILILQEVLYGKNSKGIKKADIPNRNTNNNELSISLTLEVDSIPYRIFHYRNASKITVSLFKGKEDISDHTATNTYKKIEKLLGISFEEFCQLIYQSTDSSLEFLKATDTSRKKFLISLLNLSEYSKLETTFKNIFSSVHTRRVELESSLSTIDTWLSKITSKVLEPILLREVPPDPENLREELASARVQQKELTTLAERITVNEKNKILLQQLEEKLNAYKGIAAADLDREIQEQARVEKNLSNAKEELAVQKAKLKEYKEIKDTCPTCKRKFEEVDSSLIVKCIEVTNEAIAIKAKEISAIEAALKEYSSRISAYYKHVDNIASISSIIIDTTLPDHIGNIPNVSLINRKLTAKLEEIEQIRQFNTSAIAHNAKIEELRAQLHDYASQKEVINKELKEVVAREARVSVLRDAFSTKGIVAYKIEHMIKDLESLINQYLLEFSAGRFSLSFIVSNDKLNVVVNDDGKEISITALSSGELARVNTSTLLAIRKLLNSLSSNRINLLFLDEVLNVLDEDGKQKLISVLSEEQDLNSFIVSHGWCHPLVARLRVSKTNGISEVKED